MPPPATPAQKVSALSARFTTAGFAHAFGGDVAVEALVQRWPIVRIDLHVFAPPREAAAVLARLAVLGLAADRAAATDRIAVRGGLELDFAGTPLQLRFGVDGLHALAQPRLRRVPFAERYVSVLSAEDLLLEAALAERPAGGPTPSALAAALGPDLDRAYLRRAIAALGGAGPLQDLATLLSGPVAEAPPR